MSIHKPVTAESVLRAPPVSRETLCPLGQPEKAIRPRASDRTMVGTLPPTLLARVRHCRRRHHNRVNLLGTKTAGASQHKLGWKAPQKLTLLPVAGEFFLLTFPSYRTGLSPCMVRRRVASETSLAVGLRQCIRPLVESMTPGHDGHPLAFVPINWTASLETFGDIRFRKRGIDPLPISIREQTGRMFF